MFPLNLFSMRGFRVEYFSYSVAMLPGNEREDVEKGGKIILPPSALEQLTNLNITYPMLFKLSNQQTQRVSHCGVLEFVADEGNAYLPHWMMRNLTLGEGDPVLVEYACLPVATFSKFQPHTADFLDIHNPKAVLENTLRGFACLTTGDIINIRYNQKNYELSVLETQPGDAVSIIECDMNVDFAPPEGYVEPEGRAAEEAPEEVEVGFVPFCGAGQRLDGKARRSADPSPASVRSPSRQRTRGVPDTEWRIGSLVFNRSVVAPASSSREEDKFHPFAGRGNVLSKTD